MLGADTIELVFESGQCKSSLLWTEPGTHPYATLAMPEVDFACGAIAVEEPGADPKGPWYLRRKDP